MIRLKLTPNHTEPCIGCGIDTWWWPDNVGPALCKNCASNPTPIISTLTAELTALRERLERVTVAAEAMFEADKIMFDMEDGNVDYTEDEWEEAVENMHKAYDALRALTAPANESGVGK